MIGWRSVAVVVSVLALAGGTCASAQGGSCRDPWINSAFNQVFHRAPQGNGTVGECNINLYGGGRWSNYQDLVNKVQGSKYCSDAWIGEAYVLAFRRAPQGNECSPANYGGGRWSNFDDLVAKVQQYQRQRSSVGYNRPPAVTPSAPSSGGACRDAWVSQAVAQVRHRQAYGSGDIGECNPALYGAHWSSYPDLLSRVEQSSRALDQAGLQFLPGGRGFNDTKFIQTINGDGWIGPANQAPHNGIANWFIPLAGGFDLAIRRKCPPNEVGYGGGNGCVANANTPSQPVSTRPLAIVSAMGAKCLDVEGGRAYRGARVIGYPCNGNSNEQYVFTPAGAIMQGGLCLDASGGLGRDGDQIQLWDCNGGANQRWRLVNNTLMGINNRCIDLKGGQGWWFGNQPAILWDCNGQVNQHWYRGAVVSRSQVRGGVPVQPGALFQLHPLSAAGVIGAGAGNVIGAGAGNVIAAGSGNVIAAGGGNVIAAGGGNVIAPFAQ